MGAFTRESNKDRFKSKEWKQFELNPGPNEGVYHIDSIGLSIKFIVFYWDVAAPIVFMDLDPAPSPVSYPSKVKLCSRSKVNVLCFTAT